MTIVSKETGTAIVVADERERKKSVLVAMADRYGMDARNFEATLRATVVPKECTKEDFAAFLLVANQYGLNPITKEIFAFPKRGGGIQPIVSIDGWCNLINSNPMLNGIEFEDKLTDDGKGIISITCKIWRKDREKPIEITEYYIECRRQTEVWEKWPRRMLRHKALIQGARYAFGFANIVDPDEAERMGITLTPPAEPVDASDGGKQDDGPPMMDLGEPKKPAAPAGAQTTAKPPVETKKAEPEPAGAAKVPRPADDDMPPVQDDGPPAIDGEILPPETKKEIEPLDLSKVKPDQDNPSTNPLGFLAWADQYMGGITTSTELDAAWNANIAEASEAIPPELHVHVWRILATHEKRLEGK